MKISFSTPQNQMKNDKNIENVSDPFKYPKVRIFEWKKKNILSLSFMDTITQPIEELKNKIKARISMLSLHDQRRCEKLSQLYSKDDSCYLYDSSTFVENGSIGIPGTIKNSYVLFSNSISSFVLGLALEIPALANQRSHDLIHTLPYDQNFDYCIDDIISKSHQLTAIQDTITQKSEEISKKEAKKLKKINEMITAENKNKKAQRATLKKLWKEVKSIRKREFSREGTIFAAEQCCKDVKNSILTLEGIIGNVISHVQELYNIQIENNNSVIQKIETLIDSLNSSIDKIDFDSDFKTFIKTKKIIRYDIIPEEFKPIDSNHPVFNELNIQLVTIVPSLQIYPLAIAKVLRTFSPEYSNEIAITRGKLVYFLEDLSFDWVLIRNPYTRAIGYAPSSFFEIVSPTTGVIMNKCYIDQLLIPRGEYVAILDMDEVYSEVVTITNVKGKVLKSNVAPINQL